MFFFLKNNNNKVNSVVKCRKMCCNKVKVNKLNHEHKIDPFHNMETFIVLILRHIYKFIPQ